MQYASHPIILWILSSVRLFVKLPHPGWIFWRIPAVFQEKRLPWVGRCLLFSSGMLFLWICRLGLSRRLIGEALSKSYDCAQLSSVGWFVSAPSVSTSLILCDRVHLSYVGLVRQCTCCQCALSTFSIFYDLPYVSSAGLVRQCTLCQCVLNALRQPVPAVCRFSLGLLWWHFCLICESDSDQGWGDIN